MNRADLVQLETLLQAAWELLGGGTSSMPDDEAETAHMLVGHVLDRVKYVTSGRADKVVTP